MRATFALALLALTASLAASAGPTVRAGDLTNRDACLANGNSSESCDCLERYVRDRSAKAKGPSATVEAVKRGEATPGSASDDLAAMGIVIQATVDGAKACNVKTKN